MMNKSDIYLKMLKQERNVYELAELYEQNRRKPADYIDELQCPESREKLEIKGDRLQNVGTGLSFPIMNNVLDFTESSENKDANWDKMNRQFLNYHKSLSVYTMLNSMPFQNYVARETGLDRVQGAKVLDVGAGTGHVLASLFRYPEKVSYYLMDPNLRLLHDHFIRFYPLLPDLPIAHILAYAEKIPFRDENFDVLMSLAAIDHFADIEAFFAEACRVLRPGGELYIASHLDLPAGIGKRTESKGLASFFEKAAKHLYFRKHRVGSDDHTYHFKDSKAYIEWIEKAGFKIEKEETFGVYFYIKALKQ